MRIATKWQIDGKFKIINHIYGDKNFAEDPLEIHPKTCNDRSYIPEESVETALINSNNDNYSETDKPINILIPMIQVKLHLIAKKL